VSTSPAQANSDGARGALAHLPLFEKLDHAEQAALLGEMRHEHADENQTVVWMGDKGDSLYLIERGRVTVTVPNEQGTLMTLDVLGPGQIFGEVSLLDGGPRTATIRAVEPTDLLVLSRERFRDFLRQYPDAAMDILAVMGQRQRSTTAVLRGMKNPNDVFAARLTLWQRVSDVIAAAAASPGFMLFHVAWFGLWVGLHMIGVLGFDPFPFGLLTMIVSLEAIFLALFVMVSQNRQSEKDRVRTDLDYQVNVRAETQISEIARRLERVEERISRRD
jgi:uncharacterized membrane protein